MRRTIIGTLLAISLIAAPSLASANPLAIITGDGAAEAQGQADGEYYVDASGALDAADEHHQDAQNAVNSEARSANEAVTDAQWDAYDTIDDAEAPQMDDDLIDDELTDEIEQAGDVQAQHADRVQKAADLETGYVDAGADVSLAAKAQAWAKDTFKGLTSFFDDADELRDHETDLDEQAKDELKGALKEENSLRNEVVSQAHLDQESPDVDPSLSGDANLEHATQAATSAAGDGAIQVP